MTELFWQGFYKSASIASTVTKGLKAVGKAPRKAGGALDYSTMKAVPKPEAPALNYAAMNDAQKAKKGIAEAGAATIDYSGGKPALKAKGAPIPPKGALAKPVAPSEARLKNLAKGSTRKTDWNEAIGAQA